MSFGLRGVQQVVNERGDLRNPTFMVYEFKEGRGFVHARCAGRRVR